MQHVTVWCQRHIDQSLFRGIIVTVGALAVAQQIYLPQAEGYFHLALLLIFVVLNDVRAHHRRDFAIDLSFLATILLASAFSAFQGLIPGSVAHGYRVATAAASILAALNFLSLRTIVHGKDKEAIRENHHKLLSGTTWFVELLLFGAAGAGLVAASWLISRMFI